MDSPRHTTQLRVTKYDRCDPTYTADWISISDIGMAFRGEVLTLERYLDVENRHLRVVASFLDDAGVGGTVARAVETYQCRWWAQEGESLSSLETIDVVRDMLRERGYCRLDADRAVYIHVGYDYCLYLGGDVRCQRTLALATELGLFVDTGYVSPHHPDPEDEELV